MSLCALLSDFETIDQNECQFLNVHMFCDGEIKVRGVIAQGVTICHKFCLGMTGYTFSPMNCRLFRTVISVYHFKEEVPSNVFEGRQKS